MSEEDVEIVARAYEAFGRLDAEAFVAFCDPDVEFRSPAEDRYHGHDGVRDFFRVCLRSLSRYPTTLLALEVIDGAIEPWSAAGFGSVGAATRLKSSSRSSGA